MINTEDLLKAGLHLGHKKQRTHPKANKYIYGYENGVAVFDLYKTHTLLDQALNYIKELKKQKKIIIIVATKKTISETVTKYAKENKIAYMTNKWIGGFLTNFPSIKKNINRVNEMITQKNNGEWDKLIKHERMTLEKKVNRLLSVYEGVLNIDNIPDAIFVIDIKKEKGAITEAKKCNVNIIAVTDSNTNPDLVEFPIPANDDALTSVEFITDKVVKAYRN